MKRQRNATTVAEIARPYRVNMEWIDATVRPYNVRAHSYEAFGIRLVMNERTNREVVVPYSNLKEISVEQD